MANPCSWCDVRSATESAHHLELGTLALCKPCLTELFPKPTDEHFTKKQHAAQIPHDHKTKGWGRDSFVQRSMTVRSGKRRR